ncbi:MAG: hypothetical protein U9Q71_08775 [Pseudomonadota bacterium]|nr:hypothetical protein [Pseudomonadota bacterium]
MVAASLKYSARRALAASCVASALLLAGCTLAGPNVIRSGRLSYNDAITETNNQQMLLVSVRNRYAEESSLLAVASVTANVRVITGAAVHLVFGNVEDYSGNLAPFSANGVYEENPTIFYVPVQGQQYLQQLTSPVSIGVLAQLTATLADPAPVYGALVSSVNGIDNPDFYSPSVDPDPRFGRVVSIMTELTRRHLLHWVEDAQHPGAFSVVIDGYAPTYAAEVDVLLRLLGLTAQKDPSQAVVLPVFLALDGRDSGAIGITTRSVLRLIEILSAAVEVPQQDEDDGFATDYPPLGQQS